ncbi:IS5 family transposase [Hymenobacter sp. PAMC 26628]|uniref:IS5 family transposase n=1 Tax=Hymenobacter sp. PAMC 26628 TaxID=1484118 RepID=UPI000A84E38D|nr:IS5 family transposase [Hymenobacter sp. PAMC 26628]
MATVQEFTISDTLWARLAPLLPAHVGKAHPLGCHRPRIPDRDARSAIFFVLRTGCQWKALDATGLCQSSTAHSRFQQWVQAGVFARRWDEALGDYDELLGLNFAWMALDGSLHKAPLGGKKNRPQPHGPRQRRRQAQPVDGGPGHPGGAGARRGQPPRREAGGEHLGQRAAPGRSGPASPPGSGQQGLCLAAGYASKQVRELLAGLGYTAHIRPRGEEVQAKKAGQKARRWAVERTHSWRNRFRHLLIRWAKKPENYLAMLHFACARITWSNCLFG